MTSGPQDAYERARKTYTELLTAKERTQIDAPTSLSDLICKAQILGQAFKQQPPFLHRVGDAAVQVKPFEKLLEGVCKLLPGKGGDLIWASILFVLDLARDNLEVFNEILDFFVTMSEEMAYIKILEETFSNAPLVVAVIEALYIAILDFWVKAVKYYRPKPSKRARLFSSMRIFASSNTMAQRFQLLTAEISAQKNRLHVVASAQHYKDSAAYREKVDVGHRTNLISWINAPSYEVDLNSATKHHYAGTCEWILKKQEYMEWEKRIDGSLLVIYGIPGAGKTILSSWLINRAQREAEVSGKYLLYHFFKANDDSKRTPLSAMRSLIEQLYDQLKRTNPFLLTALETELDTLSAKAQVTFMQLWFILSTILSTLCQSHTPSCSPAVTIILDAMDECKGSKPLVRELHRLAHKEAGVIRVIITSRKSGEHVDEFSRIPTRELHILEISRDDVKHDIASFTRYKIEKVERLRGDQHVSLRNTVIAELGKVENHQGMFLWSYLVCKEVKSQLNVSGIWKLLKNLPKGLDAMYARICIRLAENDQHREFGRSVLEWIVASSRPLRFAELEQALKTMEQPDDFFDDKVYEEEYGLGLLWSRKDIVEACGDLVTYTGFDDGDMIGLVHLSARHFLSSKAAQLVLPPDLSAASSASISTFLVDIHKAEYLIGSTCLNYLLVGVLHSDDIFVDTRRINDEKKVALSKRYPLLSYSIVYWPEYVYNSFANPSTEVVIETLATKASLFIAHPFSVVWLQEYIRYSGAETAAYIVRRFSELPANAVPKDLLKWSNAVARILNDFSRTLSRNPSAIRVCLARPNGVPNPYQPQCQVFIRPNSPSGKAAQVSATPPLEKSNGRWLHYDPITDTVFSVDLSSDTICLRRHVLSTGMPLRPAVFETPEPDLYSFRSAAISARAGFIAVTFGSSGPYYERDRERYTTVCWSLITSGQLSRTSEWAEVAFVDIVDGPQADKFTNMLQEVSMVAFGIDNTLIAPGGIWNILTEEQISASDLIYNPVDGERMKNVCFSANGERVARIRTRSDADVMEVLDIQGNSICEVKFPHSAALQILSFSPTGQKLVFQCHPPAASEYKNSTLEFICLVVDRAGGPGLQISVPHPLRHKGMQYLRFTKDENRIVSIIPGFETVDDSSGELSQHDYGCSVVVWSFDKDDQGCYLTQASIVYLLKSRDKCDDFAFCLTRFPMRQKNQQWEDGLIAVTKSGTVVQRRLAQEWTAEEEKQMASSHDELSSTFGSVLAEKVLWPISNAPELLLILEDVRHVPFHASFLCISSSCVPYSDNGFAIQKWVLSSAKPDLISNTRNSFHQTFRHNENCFFSSTGSYFIDVPANELYQVHILAGGLDLRAVPLPLVIDGCAFSSDDQRVAFIHFKGSDVMISIFDVEDGLVSKQRESQSLSTILGLNSQSDLDASKMQHSKSSSRFFKVAFHPGNSDILAVSCCYFKFNLPLGTLLMKLTEDGVSMERINDQFMLSLRFSTCGKYIYNGDMFFDSVPKLFHLPNDAIRPNISDVTHPSSIKFGVFCVCSPHIFKLREDAQSGTVYLDHKFIDQDNELYRSREICIRPDALPDRNAETTLLWPNENEKEGLDEVELIIASQEVIVIKTGIRSCQMMQDSFWFSEGTI
ncbi:hypothetical protein H0H92_005111 [Tricholoma furcatifolium]|nr:hypothetical protein H0H92_005111 [Tricholoma furcatifolium]